MTTVRLTPQHAQAYRALMLDAYAQHPDAFTSSVGERAALPLAWWQARLAEGPNVAEAVWASIAGEVIQGVAGLSFERREKVRHKATLFGMYVRPDVRGQGLGRQLVDAVLAHARTCPEISLLQLTVTDGNAGAIALYRAAGFEAWGHEPWAVRVGEGFVHKQHMWCPLNEPVPGTQHA
jgi:ribosomal protein S18 acetylase RimI-like enzyme